MEKWFIWGAAFVAVFFILMANLTTALSEEAHGGFYGKEWGLNLPPSNGGVIEVLGSRPIPEENRVRFTIMTYKDIDVPSKSRGWKKITEENVDEMQQKLHEFQVQSIQYVNYLDENELKDVFMEYSADPQIGDYYYFKKDRKDNYFLALYLVSENEVHTYQLLK